MLIYDSVLKGNYQNVDRKLKYDDKKCLFYEA